MARPFPNVHPLNPVEVSRFQKNIDEKLTDFRVDAGEASELVQLWSHDTYTPAQASELRRAVDASVARFDRGARRIVRDFVTNQLPKLTLPLGGGLPATSVRLTWTPPVAHVDGTPVVALVTGATMLFKRYRPERTFGFAPGKPRCSRKKTRRCESPPWSAQKSVGEGPLRA
jgi:hypothetical protein